MCQRQLVAAVAMVAESLLVVADCFRPCGPSCCDSLVSLTEAEPSSRPTREADVPRYSVFVANVLHKSFLNPPFF